MPARSGAAIPPEPRLLPLPPAPPGRTLVLGAGGFLGGHAARWLAAAGAKARLFDLAVDTIPSWVREAPGIETVHGNLMDDAILRRALSGVERVLCFVSATVPATSVRAVELELRANVQPTLRLLEAMRDAGVPLVVFPSSGGTIYGDDPPATGFAESSPARPAGSYGLGKRLLEEILAFESRHGGPSHLVLRIANAYGPIAHGHPKQGVIPAFLERVRAGQPVRVWGDGGAVRDYVHAEDVLAALAGLLAAGARDETWNVGSGTGHDLLALLEIVSEVVGRPLVIERARDEYTGVRRSLLDVSGLRARTGFAPQIDLRAGVAHVWRSLLALRPA